MKCKAVTIRGMPSDLWTALKIEAIKAQKPLNKYIVDILKNRRSKNERS